MSESRPVRRFCGSADLTPIGDGPPTPDLIGAAEGG
jgi:hypothetical protein